MYERLLLTTDGSKGSEVAAEHAIELADQYGAELHILYVVDTGVDTSISAVSDLMSELESTENLKQAGIEATETLQERAEEEGVEAITSIENGVPYREINSYIDGEDIDIIVMGTHGRTGLDRLLLGSVTEKVIRMSDAPVITVRRDDKGADSGEIT